MARGFTSSMKISQTLPFSFTVSLVWLFHLNLFYPAVGQSASLLNKSQNNLHSVLKDYFTTCIFWVALLKPQQTASVLFCCPGEVKSHLSWVQQLINGKVSNLANHGWQGYGKRASFPCLQLYMVDKGKMFFFLIFLSRLLFYFHFCSCDKRNWEKCLFCYSQIVV